MFFDSMAAVIGQWHWASSLPCSPPPRSWPPRVQMETVLLGAFFFQELQERLPSVTHILDQQLVLANPVLHVQVVFPEQGPGDRLVFVGTPEEGDAEGGSPREANNVAYFFVRGHHEALQQLQKCVRSQRSSEGLQLMLRVLHATRAFGKASKICSQNTNAGMPCTR